jgi:hypothetical protein
MDNPLAVNERVEENPNEYSAYLAFQIAERPPISRRFSAIFFDFTPILNPSPRIFHQNLL